MPLFTPFDATNETNLLDTKFVWLVFALLCDVICQKQFCITFSGLKPSIHRFQVIYTRASQMKTLKVQKKEKC
jgi:hypothetical protein